jgi:hypothetical protein
MKLFEKGNKGQSLNLLIRFVRNLLYNKKKIKLVYEINFELI